MRAFIAVCEYLGYAGQPSTPGGIRTKDQAGRDEPSGIEFMHAEQYDAHINPSSMSQLKGTHAGRRALSIRGSWLFQRSRHGGALEWASLRIRGTAPIPQRRCPRWRPPLLG